MPLGSEVEEVFRARWKKSPRYATEVIPYSTGGKINDFKYLEIKNNAWKKSRGKADWVIVVDMDEFLYHLDDDRIRRALESLAPHIGAIEAELACRAITEYQVGKMEKGFTA